MDNFDVLYGHVHELLIDMKNSFDSIVYERKTIGDKYSKLRRSFESEAKAHKDCRDKLEEIMKENEKMKAQIAALEQTSITEEK